MTAKEGVKHRKCFTPSFVVIDFSATHSSWPNAGGPVKIYAQNCLQAPAE